MLREAEQAGMLDACMADAETCPRYYRGLRHLLLKAAAIPADRQIRLINHYVNRKRYANDRTATLDTPLSEETLRYRSRWATVEEFMRRGGDCEDYATTKYYLLRRLGFDAEQLRVVVTWDRSARGYHAVLAVHHAGEVLLLESDDTVRRGRNHRYRFIYSVNEQSIWDHEAAAESARIERKSKQAASANSPEATPADPLANEPTLENLRPTKQTAKG
ncbi:MAG: transglutaminase-like cysteine peptidase [Pseudomonadota bacterium]